MKKRFLESRFSKLYGLPCWQVRRGFGSFLTMEFGVPKLEICERKVLPKLHPELQPYLKRYRSVTVAGRWTFWVYCSAWKFIMKNRLVGDSSSKRSIDSAIAVMQGQKLKKFSLNLKCRETIFEFDLGGKLIICPYDFDSELWHLYEPGGKVLSYRADNLYSYAMGNTSPDDLNWREPK